MIDPICAHCGQPRSVHEEDKRRGEIYCFPHTNGDLWSDEPGDEEIGGWIARYMPEVWQQARTGWRKEHGHEPKEQP